MKKIVKKSARIVIVTLVTAILFSVVAFATETGILYTAAGISGNWKDETSHSLTSVSTSVYGGDVGLYTYVSSVGLPNSFVYNASRPTYGKLYENDAFNDDLAREFSYGYGYQNGIYTINTLGTIYTNSAKIEVDSNVELYLSFFVSQVTGDQTRNVPTNLYKYKIWVR